MSDSPVQAAIAEWQSKQITGAELMRQLVSFDKWMVPIAEPAAAEAMGAGSSPRLMYSQDAEGVSRLYLFSDGPAYDAFRRAVGDDAPQDQHFLTTPGAWIFHLPLDQIDAVEIDPASPWQISYRKEQFTRLRALADAVEVEQALAALRTGTAQRGMVATVRLYERYILAVCQINGEYSLALAPDDHGRALAAVFTADDTFEAFLSEGEAVTPQGQLLRLTLPGAQLFEQLAKMPVDGVVFNCSGPVRPIAFAHEFFGVVLEAKTGD